MDTATKPCPCPACDRESFKRWFGYYPEQALEEDRKNHDKFSRAVLHLVHKGKSP